MTRIRLISLAGFALAALAAIELAVTALLSLASAGFLVASLRPLRPSELELA